MIKKLMAAVLALVSISALADAGYVTNVLVRQRWPWSHKVDIDFTVGGTEKVDVECSAVWDGHPDPLLLSPANGLSGSAYGLANTQGHLVWNPHAAGLTNTLTGFRVTISASAVSERKYLVFDLTNGSYEYMADEPQGGFNADDTYKKTKIAFRRIPAGTFTMGVTSAQKSAVDRVGGASTFFKNKWFSKKAVTLSDDYYLAVYRMTKAQYSYVSSGTASSDKEICTYTSDRSETRYNTNRGLTNTVGEAINWPVTGYDVATNSFYGKFRKLTGGRFVIDYPTEAQWEHAARADSEKLWWDYGDDDITAPAFTNYLVGICAKQTSGTYEPGGYAANAYGLYDMVGNMFEPCLDSYDTTSPAAVDPVGPTGTATGQRVAKGGGSASWFANPGKCIPAFRIGISPNVGRDSSYGQITLRPAIHLNSVFDR